MTTIEIEEDGWVYMRYLAEDGGILDEGLGDIGVDVQIIDKRSFVHRLRAWMGRKMVE